MAEKWKLVPLEPTPDMMCAAWDHTPLVMDDMTDGDFGQAYKDMLGSAPVAPDVFAMTVDDAIRIVGANSTLEEMRQAFMANVGFPVAVQEEGDALIAALKEAAILLSAVAPFMEQRGSSDYTAGAKRINAVLAAMKGDQP